MKTFLILHNIRSEHNVGSIFRTAEASGVEKIYLSGYTPAPVDRFGRKVSSISKVALGAEEFVLWEQVQDINTLLEKLKSGDFEIVSVEQDEKSIDYKKYIQNKNTVYILGDEVRGVPKDILDRSDVILEIPMKGKKESLNVSVTAGIILFR